MVTDLRPAHVLHGQVTHNLRHAPECLVARLLGRGLVWLHPEAGDLLLDPRAPHVAAAHVAEEGAVGGHRGGHRPVTPGVAGVHVVHHVVT